MLGAIKSLWENLKARQYRGSRIEYDADRLALYRYVGKNSKLVRQTKWREINAVFAFKWDCYTVDQIRLAIETLEDGAFVLTEDDEGWDLLSKNLDALLPGCRPFNDWFSEVAFPAFETNWTQIYSKAARDD